jgi:hypothetical protein
MERHIQHNLFFIVELPKKGPVWLALNAMIETQLSSHGLTLSPPPPTVNIRPEGIQFHELPWMLLQPGRRCPDGTSKFQQHPTMTGGDFNVAELEKIGKKTPNVLARYSCQNVIVLGLPSLYPVFSISHLLNRIFGHVSATL